MSKSNYSFSPTLSRRKRSKKTAKDVHMNIVINKQQETTILETIKTLYAREYKKNVDRDAEFVRFLQGMYRSCQSRLRPLYVGAPQNVLKSCANQVENFQGVNKRAKESDAANLLKSIRFDLDEGKSWADQRRAKWIVPLCIGWLNAVEQEAERLTSELDLPDTFLVDSIVKLLTTSYHPPARQSTTTNLICTQTMNHKDFRNRLLELTEIELPRPKEMISRWLSEVRENGLQTRSAASTMFSASPSAAIDRDDTVRRELERRNSALEHELAATKHTLRECQNALAACQQERDQLRTQIQRIQSCCGPPMAMNGWPSHGVQGYGYDVPSQSMPMPAVMPVQPNLPPPSSYNFHYDSNVPNSSQRHDFPSSWSSGWQPY